MSGEGMSGEKRVERVTCRNCRKYFYFYALLISAVGLFSGVTCWKNPNDFNMPKYTWFITGATSIVYLGMVIWCMFKDVPVPTYRLEKDGRWNLFYIVAIAMYRISYFVPEMIRFEACYFAMILITALILIVQLYWPAEDFTSDHMLCTVALGIWFAVLGMLGSTGWGGLIITIFYFPLGIMVMPMFDNSPSGLEHQYHRTGSEKSFRLI